jgi:hypothetical protein
VAAAPAGRRGQRVDLAPADLLDPLDDELRHPVEAAQRTVARVGLMTSTTCSSPR